MHKVFVGMAAVAVELTVEMKGQESQTMKIMHLDEFMNKRKRGSCKVLSR